MSDMKNEALNYHRLPAPGKVEVVPKKSCRTQKELALAYTPGVALPCLEIARDKELSYSYTSKGNLVGVISNGTAVLGLGNIGAAASKPVMEGKGILFKIFADIDVFDIEIDENDPDKIIETIARLEPTFGGINLEDIKAPECFYIEEKLKSMMKIPVFHDDQHGTAIICGAALINALEIAGKEIGNVKVVFSGAGAAGISCAKFFLTLGVKKENLTLTDIDGVVYKGRKNMNAQLEFFASDTADRTLGEAIKNADVFVGVSAKGVLKEEMIRSMAPNPIVFAMANPEPEIEYEKAVAVRKDLIMATGRSDYPNQVNNVLGFPFIFRGALDVRASTINEEMKIAASRSLAALAKLPVPDEVKAAYNVKELNFGREYIIPKPFDKRAFIEVSLSVARAAYESGVAGIKTFDENEYRKALELRYTEKISRL